jgi:hypothetical protein
VLNANLFLLRYKFFTVVVVVLVVVAVSDQSICSVADLDGCEAQHDGSFFLCLVGSCEVKRLLALCVVEVLFHQSVTLDIRFALIFVRYRLASRVVS